MKNILKFVIMGFILTFFNCKNKTTVPKVKDVKLTTDKIKEEKPLINDVDVTFKAEINNVYKAYNQLKDALIASDSVASIAAAKAVITALDKGNMSLLKKNASHKIWMSQKPVLKKNLNKLIGTASLAAQRLAFLDISNSMIKLIENFGINKKVMVQFCPMADDFKGGYWLSTDTKIKNPYFGSKMLTCGSTKRIIN